MKIKIGLPPCNIFFEFTRLIEYVGLKFHYFFLCNFSKFWFTPSFGMSRHHLHEKNITGGNPNKKYYKGVNRAKKHYNG
jgi:hypothetical protein